MTDETLRKNLDEALAKINALPEAERGPLLALLEETRQRHGQLKESFAKIAVAVEDWRLTMQYLLFDHEASQREIADLRRRLEGREG